MGMLRLHIVGGLIKCDKVCERPLVNCKGLAIQSVVQRSASMPETDMQTLRPSPRPSESEFSHVLESLGDSDPHLGFGATDTKKWLRKPVTVKDLHTIMSSYKSPS